MQVTEVFTVRSPVEKVWELVSDMQRFSECVREVERCTVIDDTSCSAVAKVKIGFIKMAFNINTKIIEKEPLKLLRVQNKGEDVLGAGSFVQEVVLTLSAKGPEETEVRYDATTTMTGRMAVFGERIMRATAKRMGADFVREVKARLENSAEQLS